MVVQYAMAIDHQESVLSKLLGIKNKVNFHLFLTNKTNSMIEENFKVQNKNKMQYFSTQ